ncbi:DUF305 domain-containing protein [Paraburkholderia sp. DGU8]|uniref:CopM family metallochaperone n=1 Tax=Paraburkholderia sp. DGU8 TaxID=3161997 RepID=UPI003466B71C
MKNLRAFRTLCWFSGLTLAVAAMPVHAQHMPAIHGMQMSGSEDGAAAESTRAFKAADDKMMRDMSAPEYTGDADKDFVAHMIPHHQGAIDMAQVELKYGKDPQLKRLAQNIIKAQHDEIAFMHRWQAKHGGK